jgi:hypothetical protein
LILLQFIPPTSRGIPANNIRFHSQSIKMLSGNENSTIALSQVLAQRRVQTLSVQKPQTVQQQMTVDASTVSPGTSQQGQIQTSPNPSQTVTQPQNSPQQVRPTQAPEASPCSSVFSFQK